MDSDKRGAAIGDTNDTKSKTADIVAIPRGRTVRCSVGFRFRHQAVMTLCAFNFRLYLRDQRMCYPAPGKRMPGECPR
jgi:hypothetical protein